MKEALEKLKLNDDSIVFEPETSQALGFGFRCGFLGLLHMDVSEERIERDEWNIERKGLRFQKEKCLEYKNKKAKAVRKGFDIKVRECFQELAI